MTIGCVEFGQLLQGLVRCTLPALVALRQDQSHGVEHGGVARALALLQAPRPHTLWRQPHAAP